MPVYVNIYEELVGRVLCFAAGDDQLDLPCKSYVSLVWGSPLCGSPLGVRVNPAMSMSMSEL